MVHNGLFAQLLCLKKRAFFNPVVDFRANVHGDQRHPELRKALAAMAVSLTPALSQRARGTRSALRAPFTVTSPTHEVVGEAKS